MNLPIILLGTGGHARVLLDMMRIREWNICGAISPDMQSGDMFHGIPVCGNDSWVIQNCSPDAVRLVNGIGSVGTTVRRRSVFDIFKAQGYEFASITHPSSVIATDVELGEGVQVMAGAVIQPGAKIGANSIINTCSSIDHDCIISSHVHVAPGATICGNVCIGDGSHVGTGASIIQGIKVGCGALIGAGTVVLRNIGERQMVLGIPGRAVKTMKNWEKTLASPDTTIQNVIRLIDQEALRIALVVDDKAVLLGTVTDGDIRRAILSGKSLEGAVSTIMNLAPIVLQENETREKALSIMAEHSIHQLPVIDRQGRIIGLELLENLISSRG